MQSAQTQAQSPHAPSVARREILSAADEIRAALIGLGDNVTVQIAREPDWMMVRGLLIPPEPGTTTGSLMLRVSAGSMDSGWVNAPAFVSLQRPDGPWSFRTVIRAVSEGKGESAGEITADRPGELRPFAPPWPGEERRAVPIRAAATAPFRRVSIETFGDDATRALFNSVSGADLQLRSCSLGTRINHVGRMVGLVAMLAREEALALAVAGQHTMHPVRVQQVNHSDGRWALCAVFNAAPPPSVKPGVTAFITGVMGTELYTMGVRVEAVGGERLVLLAAPKAIYRYQRRAARRYRLLRADLRVELTAADGRMGEFALSDISLTGMGVEHRRGHVPSTPEAVAIRLSIADVQSLALRGQCVGRSRGEDDAAPYKVGLQFLDLEPRQLRIIGRLIQKLGRPV